MRDNVSIIFAAIFAVMLLIVFPLFSLLTRQDNISYNKVLTITTEFVDSVRTKGYFTEQEYSNFLVNLATTQNTYKVDMECHKKLMIKDVNKYTSSNPAWVEDTAIYYNSYVNNMLDTQGSVTFDSSDEFYVKVYNTNITTASLIYNFFLNSNIPKKVINVSYGGKVLNSTGTMFSKTTFNLSNSPYITFGEVMDNNSEIFKRCYDQEVGEYAMQYCTRIVDIDDENNNPIKVKFQLHNFDTIGGVLVSDSTFESNKENLSSAIKEYVELRGDYITSYEVDIDSLEIQSGIIEGTIKISNIEIGYGEWKTSAYIAIKPALGSNATGAASSEGITDELILRRDDPASNISIDGPYLTQASSDVITTNLKVGTAVYYKVSIRDKSRVGDNIKKLELFDTKNSKSLGVIDYAKVGEEYTLDKYTLKIESRQTNNKTEEYWIKVTPKFGDSMDNLFIKIEEELQIVAYDDTLISDIKSLSKVVIWENEYVDVAKIYNNGISTNISAIDEATLENSVYVFGGSITISLDADVASKIKEYKDEHKMSDTQIAEMLVNSGIIYLSKSEKASVGDISIKVKSATIDATSDKKFRIEFDYVQKIIGKPVDKETAYVYFKNASGNTVSTSYDRRIINIPQGFYRIYKEDGIIAIKDSEGNVYYWISISEDVLNKGMTDYLNYYGDNGENLKARIIESIKTYGGIYVCSTVKKVGNGKFMESWSDSISLKNSQEDSQLFSSMIYMWQWYVFKNSGLKTSSDDKFWTASRYQNHAEVAVWLGGSGTPDYDNVYDTNTNSYGYLQVLYIK